MNWLAVKDNATGQLQAQINDSVATVTLKNTHGAKFPVGNFIVTIGQEHLLVTERTGDVLSVVRGYDGTMASEHAADSIVELRFIAKIIDDITDEIDAVESDASAHYDDDTIHHLMSAIANAVYPVGSVYINKTDNRNPSAILGVGTWVALEGVAVVGYKSGDADFGTPGAVVGVKAVTLTGAQSGVPVHSHQIRTKNDDFNFTSGTLGVGPTFADAKDGISSYNNFSGIVLDNVAANAAAAHTNIQPSVVSYVWERTA